MDLMVKKSMMRGVIGSFLLLAFYFGVLTLANSFSHAVSQFSSLWYWILALVIGFGIQVGLWFYIRSKINYSAAERRSIPAAGGKSLIRRNGIYPLRKRRGITAEIKEEKIKGAAGEVAATGGISAGSMIACCAHHLIDVAPLLGLSALFLFLAQYQIFFLIFGILSNIIGIILMLEIIQKHSLYQEDGIFNYLAKINFKDIKKPAMAGVVMILFVSFFGIKNLTKMSLMAIDNQPAAELNQKISLSTKNNDSGGLSIEARPIDFSFGKSMQFEITLNTHQGDLDFDLMQQSVLIDDFNNTYLPLEWQGGRGGHHLSGKLIFPSLKEMTKKIKLVINNVYGIKERVFEWDLE